MAKVVRATLKMKIKGGAATPALGAVLGQYQVNIPGFCKQFNDMTSNRKGEIIPVSMIVYQDKTFDFVLKTPQTSALILQKANVQKGSAVPNKNKVGKLTKTDVEEIAKIKMQDLNAMDIEQAKRVVAGTARSMGIEVE